MAEVLRRAVWREVAKPARTRCRCRCPAGATGSRSSGCGATSTTCAAAAADDDLQLLHYAAGRERLAMLLAEDARRQKEEAGGSPSDAETAQGAPVSAEVRAFCDARWPARGRRAPWSPRCSPTRAARPRGPRRAGRRGAGAAAARRRRPVACAAARWTAADAVLVDEVAGLLERTPGYGHVVVDEAQDLSPMQCRAVARRLAAGSLTVLGDLAQATSPWSAADWRQTLAALGRPDTVVRPLTRGYRVPGRGARVRQPAAAAHRARAAARPPRSARSPGSLQLRPVAALAGPLAEVVRRAGRRRRGRSGSSAPTPPSPAWSPCWPPPGSPSPRWPTTARAAAGSPSSRRRWPRAWSSTRSWWWSRPRSWPPSRAGCTGSTSSLTRAVSSLVVVHRGDLPELLAG